MAHPNDELISRFYAAFGRHDAEDTFSFYAWSRQALGPIGLALGWSPLVREKVQRQARAGLDEFLAHANA